MWIEKNNTITNLPVFCKKFKLDGEVSKSTLSISALGIFNIVINGIRIDDYFMPGWTNYNKYVNLCEYDITKYLKEENLIEITLANGWYSGKLGYTRDINVYGDVNALYACINLVYKNGKNKKIKTDKSWKLRNSEIVSSSFFDGENIDKNTACQTYEELSFAVQKNIIKKLEPYNYEPVKVMGYLSPQTLKQNDNFILLDFKQNFAGFISFNAKGKKGSKITIRYAEVLNSDGSLYTENLRKATSTDSIILSDEVCSFNPVFTFHGFRFVQIYIDGTAQITDIKGVILSQQIKYTGDFSCSDEIINKIYKNTLWGQKSNFISVPTDCPQRDERLGWTGDAEVFCNSAMFNSDCNLFFSNYLKLIRSDTKRDGKVPLFAPFFIEYTDKTAGIPGWADAICVIPYFHYLHYRDKQIIKDNIKNAVKHFNFYKRKSKDFVLNTVNPFGDWLSVYNNTNVDVINQCMFGYCAKLIAKMFEILNDKKNTNKFNSYFEKIRLAFRNTYLNEDYVIKSDTQTSYALAIAIGFVSSSEVKKHFVDSMAVNNNRLTTGFIGVRYLLPSLCDVGEVDLAYRVIKERKYPSWGYTIENGATTIWERWNGYTKENGFETPSMNSFNHYSLGACTEWLYSYVLGIKIDNEKICISPSLSSELEYAKGKYRTADGYIYVEWKYVDKKFFITISADEGVNYTLDFSKYKIVNQTKEKNNVKIEVEQYE